MNTLNAQGNKFTFPIVKVGILIIILTVIILAYMLVNKTVVTLFETGNDYKTVLGPIVSQEKMSKFNFAKRNQVAFFHIIRYRASEKSGHVDFVEHYDMEKNKKSPDALPIFLGQYTECEGKGTFEFNFYVDMENIESWDFDYDSKSNTLTITADSLSVSTPAELEPTKIECKVDCISIDEDEVIKRLQDEIPRLKVELAEEQKHFMHGEAKEQLAKLFRELLKKTNAPQPNIVIKFKDRQKIENHNL